jgi:hypothetical protein
MATPTNAIPDGGLNPPPPNSPSPAAPPPASRVWYIDEIVVAAFAFLGFGGAVFLPLRFNNIPPITISFLLATGLAALTYRYLGGIQGASFAVGTLKLGGTLAALVGIAMLINGKLVPQVQPPPRYQVWEVSGQVTDEAGKPIEPLNPKDVALQPPPLQPSLEGKFKLDFYSWPDLEGKMVFPVLAVSHDGYDPHPVDLSPNAPHDVEITRTGQHIEIKRIPLHVPANRYQPPQQALQQVPYSAEGSSAPSGSPQ